MKRPYLNIKTTLLVIISILNLLIAVLVGSNLYRAWGYHADATMLRHNARTINLFYNAEKHLSLERAAAMSVVFAPPGTDEILHRDLERNRRAADRSLERAVSALGNNYSPAIGMILESIRDYQQKLNDVRTALDRALEQSIDMRNPELPDWYFDSSTMLIGEIHRLIESYSRPYLPLDSTVAQQMIFKHVIGEITEYAGRENAVLGRLITENRLPSPALQEELLVWRGRVEYGWELAHQIAISSDMSLALAPYLEEAESHYFITFEQVKNIFYVPMQSFNNDTAYPISIEMWLQLASQAVESLVAMKDASLEENQRYIDRMMDDAEYAIVISLILFACALLLSTYSWWIILARVIRPVNSMVDALYKATRGEMYDLPQIDHPHDEIGKLGSVLEAFQENTRQIRQTSRELQERGHYLNTILAAIPDAIITVDERGVIQMVNPATERLFDYQASELIGRNICLLLPPLDGQAADDVYLRQHLGIGQGNVRLKGETWERTACRKQSPPFPVEMAITEMQSAGGRMFVSILRDITERKQIEEEVSRYLKDLENSNRELDDFAYITSHDLKEPLRGMHNFSRFLLEDYEDKLDDEGKSMLHTIEKLAQQMEGLLNALLHFSRLGRTDLSIRETDLNKVVQSIQDIYAISVSEKNAEIQVNGPLPTIICDHVRINEVFRNLVGNALKYNDKDHKIIEIGAIKNHPDELGKLVYYVRDNGIGIDPQHLHSIFRIFHRLHPRSAYGGGSGSGLTIAKKIINQHGGRIWAESEGSGKGTTFYFTLPLFENGDAVQAVREENLSDAPIV